MRFDFGVVGGGLIGLACAWQLVRRGARVAIYDAGHAGAATAASAGMLAAQCELAHHAPHENAEQFFDLCLHSRALYPAFVEELQGESEQALLVQRGICYVQTRADDDAIARLQAGHARGLTTEETQYPLSLRGSHAKRSSVASGFPALWLADEGAVDPRALAGALRVALERRGAMFIGAASLEEVLQTCGAALVCGGAWSARLLEARIGLPDNWLRPVAGLTLDVRSDTITRTLYASDCYVVPRGDGRVIIGATSEEHGFDTAPTLGAALGLLQAAAHLEPELAHARIEDWRRGLRPVARDGLPVIGAVDERVFVATAHGRNGVLLAPATAELVAAALCDGAPVCAAWSPHRFLSSPTKIV